MITSFRSMVHSQDGAATLEIIEDPTVALTASGRIWHLGHAVARLDPNVPTGPPPGAWLLGALRSIEL